MSLGPGWLYLGSPGACHSMAVLNLSWTLVKPVTPIGGSRRSDEKVNRTSVPLVMAAFSATALGLARPFGYRRLPRHAATSLRSLVVAGGMSTTASYLGVKHFGQRDAVDLAARIGR
jgi:hypothetical protein